MCVCVFWCVCVCVMHFSSFVCVCKQHPVNEEEACIWSAVWDQSVSVDDACERLSGLLERGVVLTHQSNDLIAIEDPANRPGKRKQ